jgi:hypothetical protein
VRAKHLPSNPADGIELPRKHEVEQRYLTHEQLHRLAVASGRFRTFVLVLGYCGLRLGEAAALRVEVNTAPPINLALRAGEVLNHLRQALAFQIYPAGGGTLDGDDADKVAFPIVTDPSAWDRVVARKVSGCPNPASHLDDALPWNSGVQFDRPAPPEISFAFRANDGTQIDAAEFPR